MKKMAAFIIFFSCFFWLAIAQEEENQTIVIESRHMVAEKIGDELFITDAILVNVHSLDGTESPLVFSVPVGYRDFDVLNGLDPGSLSLEEDRIVDKRALGLGKMPISFKYVLPVHKNTTSLSFQVYRDTQVFYFLVKNLELKIVSEQLVDEGLIDMGKRSYYALSGVAFQSGESFTITISGLGKKTRRKNVLVFAAFVVVLLIIISVFAIRKGKSEGETGSAGYDNSLKDREKALTSIIALLDEKHEKGEIGTTVYKELRRENKKKLKRVIDLIEREKIDNALD
jgi:hypothetical protein